MIGRLNFSIPSPGLLEAATAAFAWAETTKKIPTYSKTKRSMTCINCGMEKKEKRGRASWGRNKTIEMKYCDNTCQLAYENKERIAKLFAGGYIGITLKAIQKQTKTGKPNWYKQFMLVWNKYQCQECGVGDIYNGKPFTLQVEHIDGDSKNNDIENLCLICPTCHTQTFSWGQKNRQN